MEKIARRPIGVTIVSVWSFLNGLIILRLQLPILLGLVPITGPEVYQIATYATAIAEAVFAAPTLIVAGIGLWKMRDWGFAAALLVAGAKIYETFFWEPMERMCIRIGVIAYEPFWTLVAIHDVAYGIVVIAYLWRKRRSFFQ